MSRKKQVQKRSNRAQPQLRAQCQWKEIHCVFSQLSRNFLDSPRPYFQVWLVCPGNHGSPGCRHSFVSGSGTIGPRKIRHKSSIIVTSIAAPKASTATRGKSHRSPSFSSILRTQVRNHCGIERWEQKKTKYKPHYSRNSIKAVHNLHKSTTSCQLANGLILFYTNTVHI